MANQIIVAAPDQDARRINELTARAEQHARGAFEAALEAGAILATVKTRLEHGQFESWITEHCTIAPRTARAYMRLARHYEELSEAERQRVAGLPLRDAIHAISTAPEAPQRVASLRMRTKDDRERMLETCDKAQSTIKSVRSLVNHHRNIPQAKLKKVRADLEALIRVLDTLQQTLPDGARRPDTEPKE